MNRAEKLCPGKLYLFTGKNSSGKTDYDLLQVFSGKFDEALIEIIDQVSQNDTFLLLEKGVEARNRGYRKDMKILTKNGIVGYFDAWMLSLEPCR